jgi:hypothetical protein
MSHVLTKHSWENTSSILYSVPPTKYALEGDKVTVLGVDEDQNSSGFQWKVIDLPEYNAPERLAMWNEFGQGVDDDDDNNGKGSHNQQSEENDIYKEQLSLLKDMGFKVDSTTTQIIQACNGNIDQVIDLLSSNL